MLDKAKAFVKDHKEEIIIGSALVGYGIVAAAIGYNWPKKQLNGVKHADEGLINGEPVLMLTFHDGGTQLLRQTNPK